MCSSTLYDTANRLLKRTDSEGSSSAAEKKSSAVLLFLLTQSTICTQALKRKGRSSKRKGNRRCPFLFAPAAGAATSPPSADGESPAEVQRKTLRPERANPPAAVRVPQSAGAEKTCRPSGANPLTQFASPVNRCKKQRTPKPGQKAAVC